MAKIYTIVFFIFVSVGMPLFAHAATLGLSPSSLSRTVGSTFTITVSVSTSDTTINAVSGVISFPTDLLEIAGVSKAGSIISLWVQEPSFSNAQGIVTFEGITLNPGYQGSNGSVVSITFRTKAAGTAMLKFSSGSVLANDGVGTNVLTSPGSASISVLPVTGSQELLKAPPVKINADKVATSTESAAFPEVPTVTSYPSEVTVGDTVLIKGIANPGVDVVVELSHNGTVIQEQKSRATGAGEFTAILGPLSETGNYSFTVHAIDEALNESQMSPPFLVVVKEGWFTTVTNTALRYLSLGALIIFALAGVVIVSVFAWYRFLRIIRRMRREAREAERASERALTVLRDGVTKHITQLKRAKRKPATDGAEFLEELERKLKKAEDIVMKEVKDITR